MSEDTAKFPPIRTRTRPNYERMLEHALKTETKHRRRMERVAPGRSKGKAQRSYIGKFSTKVSAVHEAAKRRGTRLSPREICEVAQRVDCRRRPTATRVDVPRRAGARVTWAFDLAGHAVQIIAWRVLLSSTEVPSRQYGLGGRSTSDVVEGVAADLHEGALWIMHLDIQRCFSSFNAARVAAQLPMPRTLALNALTAVPVQGERWGAARDAGTRSSSGAMAGTNRGTGEIPTPTPTPLLDYSPYPLSSIRQAPTSSICEGSAFAPLAVFVALGYLERHLPDGVKLRAWSDNLIVTARTRRLAEQAREALARALRDDPRGRLVLRGYIRRHDWGTELLGYRVRTWRGHRPLITLSYRNFRKAERLFEAALRRDIENGATEPNHVRTFVAGWTGAFRATGGCDAWREARLNQAARALHRHTFDARTH